MFHRAIATAALLAGVVGVSVAGPLTPPAGPPAATDRAVIQSLPATISQPGSYVITSNLVGPPLVDGITVTVSDVTLDLNGFSIIGVPGSRTGILTGPGVDNLVVLNGTVTQFGRDGIDASQSNACEFVDVHLVGNQFGGLLMGGSSTAIRCSAIGNTTQGFEDFMGANTYEACVARNNSGGFVTSYTPTLRGCTASGNAQTGIVLGRGGLAFGCTSEGNGVEGVYLAEFAVATRCTSEGNFWGYRAENNAWVFQCVAGANSDVGIYTEGVWNHFEQNFVTDNAVGIRVMAPAHSNVISKNTVHANADNYDFSAGNSIDLMISEIPETLDWPCTATLAGDLISSVPGVDGLTVTASDVTIDLAGHSLVGPGPGAGPCTGIALNPIANPIDGLKVVNGSVTNWDGFGIDANGGEATLLDRVVCRENTGTGAAVVLASVVSDSIFDENGFDGLNAAGNCVVVRCTAQRNGATGLLLVDGTTAERCGSRENIDGFAVIDGAIVESCTSTFNQNFGYFVDLGSRVIGCTARFNVGTGIEVLNECDIRSNTISVNASTPGTFGINVIGTFNRISGNDVKAHPVNINVTGGRNTIYDNSAAGGAPDYAIVPGNDVCAIGPAAAGIPKGNVTY